MEYMIGLGFAGGFVSFLAVAGILRFTHQVDQKVPDQTLQTRQFLGLIGLIIVMAFIEEGLFRWLLLGVTSRWIGFLPAWLGSSAIFTVAHRPNGPLKYGTVLNLILVGLILGMIFWWW